jgi:hypothetical protein
MSTKRAAKIETPGEPHATEAEAPPAAAAPTDTSQPTSAPSAEAAAAESAAAAPALVNPLTPQVELPTASLADSAAADQAKGAELSRQVKETSKLIGSDAALDWSHLTNPAAVMAKLGVDPEAHLPTVESIEWAKVSGDRILTKQGWLLRP